MAEAEQQREVESEADGPSLPPAPPVVVGGRPDPRRRARGETKQRLVVVRRGSQAFAGAPFKCPSDRLPHYLASPECQQSPSAEEGPRGRLNQPTPGGPRTGEGCALAKGPLIISQAQSFRDPH